MCFYTNIFIKNNGFWFQVLSGPKVGFSQVQILTITYFQITGFDRFLLGSNIGFIRWFLWGCIFIVMDGYQNYDRIPHVRTFDHFIYVDYVTTSKKCCYHIKTCISDFLLPHQTAVPGAMFQSSKKNNLMLIVLGQSTKSDRSGLNNK